MSEIEKNEPGINYEEASILLIVAFLLLRMVYVIFSFLPLSPEEAYYWSYAMHPALSYFDHPPMVAWIIHISSLLIGHSEIAVRLGAIFLSAGLSWLVFQITSRLYQSRAGFFSVLALNITFVFSLYSMGITPDSPLFFFWALSIYLFMRACLDGRSVFWYLLGLAMGCAMLSKYTACFLPLSCATFLLWGEGRKDRWKGFVISVFIAALIFSPVILWNMEHNFASFSFQASDRLGSGVSLSLHNISGLFLGQAIFVTPLLFLAILYVLGKEMLSKEKEFAGRFLLCMSLPILVFFTGVTLCTWVKTNWPTPGYIGALVLLCGRFSIGVEKFRGPNRWRVITCGICISVFGLFLTLLAHLQPLFPAICPALSRANTMTGWREIATQVKSIHKEMSGMGETFVAGYGYKVASELAFYAFPGREIYSCNVFGEPALAYDYWQNTSSLSGENAVVVVSSDFKQIEPSLLTQYFSAWEEEKTLTVVIEGVQVRTFRIFRCFGYSPSGGATGRDPENESMKTSRILLP